MDCKITNHLERLRFEQDIPVNFLARKTGISRQAIYEIESNKRVPSLATACKIAFFFKKNVEDVFPYFIED